MPLDLADDVGGRIGRQLDAAVDVEAVDRLDQADRADLNEILELLTAIGVPPSGRATCTARSAVRAPADRRARGSGEAEPCRIRSRGLRGAHDTLRHPHPI